MTIYDMRTVRTAVVLPPKPEAERPKKLTERQIGSRWAELARKEGHRRGWPNNGANSGDRSVTRPKAIAVLEALGRLEAETGQPITSRQIADDTGITTQHIGDVMRGALVSGHVVIEDHIMVNNNRTRRYRLIAMPEAAERGPRAQVEQKPNTGSQKQTSRSEGRSSASQGVVSGYHKNAPAK